MKHTEEQNETSDKWRDPRVELAVENDGEKEKFASLYFIKSK